MGTNEIEIAMPALGQSVAFGTVVRWLKAPGEAIGADESLVVVETDKAVSEVPSPRAGEIAALLVEEGETVEVGRPIATLRPSEVPRSVPSDATRSTPSEVPRSAPSDATRSTPSDATRSAPSDAPAGPEDAAASGPASTPPAPRAGRGRGAGFLSPAVRRLVREHGVAEAELAAIDGSGRGGRVTHDDLTAWLARRAKGTAETPPSAEAATESRVLALTGLRARVAEHVTASRRDVPEVNTVAEADFQAMGAARAAFAEDFRRRHGFGLSWNAFLLKASATALSEFPRVNATLDGQRITEHARVHLGLAVAMEPEGILVPVVRDAHRLSVREIAVEASRLAERARSGRLSADDMAGGTCTVTNPGVFGTLLGTPVIHQPQVAIIDFGAIEKRVVVTADDAIAIRPRGYVVLAWDHRAMDGALASRFLRRLVAVIAEWPSDSIDRA